jgi:hypothetical protein
MGFFGDGIKAIAAKIDRMREEYQMMSANFKNLEKSFDKFVDQADNKLDKTLKENEDLRRRVTEMEAIISATFKSSAREALQTVLREHLRENGNVDELSDPLKKFLGLPHDSSPQIEEHK